MSQFRVFFMSQKTSSSFWRRKKNATFHHLLFTYGIWANDDICHESNNNTKGGQLIDVTLHKIPLFFKDVAQRQ